MWPFYGLTECWKNVTQFIIIINIPHKYLENTLYARIYNMYHFSYIWIK